MLAVLGSHEIMRTKFLLSSVLILLTTLSLSAQVSEKEKAQELERKQAIERRVAGMLDEMASAAWGLKLPENRVLVMSGVAELLWTRDEKRARSVFWDAINTMNLLPGPAVLEPNAKPSADEKRKAQELYFRIFSLRRLVLNRLARKDPQLALEILRATRQLPLDPRYTDFPVGDDRDLEDRLAAEAAARDPKRALQIARESLARGFSYEIQDLLFRLNRRDQELGSQFAGEIIDKFHSRNLASDVYAGQLASVLLTYSRRVSETWLPPSPSVLKLSDEQKRALVEKLVDAALTLAASPSLLSSVLPDVMPEIQEFAPDRVAAIQRKLSAFTQTLNQEQRNRNMYNSLFSEGDAEEMVRIARDLPDGERAMYYRQAVTIAAMRDKADSLREVINKEVDQSRRQDVLDWLDNEEIGWAAKRGRDKELQKLLPRIRLKEQRARAMAEIAVILEKKGDHDEALKLLGEARSLIKTDLTSETQSNALLALIFAYALIDPAQAFIIIERVVDRANDQISKLLLLDKVISSGVVRKGEIKIDHAGIMPTEFMAFKYGRGIKALANADFNRTKATADRFQRPELRLMARLLLAQALSSNVYDTRAEQLDAEP